MINVHVFADAAFGLNVHDMYKSQSGLVIKIGNSTIYAKTSKQSLVTKSSTEAELVCSSDAYSTFSLVVKWIKEKGIHINDVIMFQDNVNTIKLMESDHGYTNGSRHISIRYFFFKEKMLNGEFKVRYLPSQDMIADIMSKPIQGKLFADLKDLLLG